MSAPASASASASASAADAGAGPEPAFAEYIPFSEFRSGLPAGRFHIVVNPVLAPRFLAHKLNLLPVTIAAIGLGIAAALSGHTWLGAGMVAGGVLLRRWVRKQSGPVLVFLAARVAAIYDAATEAGVMEVQRVG